MASPDVLPITDDHDCFLTALVVLPSVAIDPGHIRVTQCGEEPLVPPISTGLAQAVKVGGVAARAGRIVAAETEHMAPGTEAQLLELGMRPERPAG